MIYKISIQQITNMNQSMATQFYEESHFSPTRITHNRSGSRLTPVRSKQSLYGNRLEEKMKQMKGILKKKKPIIQQLKGQRKFFKKICEKQREKIQGIDVNMIKSEYQQQLEQLKQDRIRLHDMIGLIHEQSNKKIGEYVQAKQELIGNRTFLQVTLAELQKQNTTYESILIDKNAIIQGLQTKKYSLEAQIRNKEIVERKYMMAMEEIGRLQRKKRSVEEFTIIQQLK